jgi:hypothetical protein
MIKKESIKKTALFFSVVLILLIPFNLILGYSIINWGWSDNIGWISMQGSSPDYVVSLNTTTGALTGYAWSDNIGWIKFDPSGTYPASPEYSAQVDLVTDQASGWARACTLAENHETCAGEGDPLAGGWDGWISLRGSDPAYGVSLSGNYLTGWGWSDSLGWIDFSEFPIRRSTITLKMKGREMGISINYQGLIEIVR